MLVAAIERELDEKTIGIHDIKVQTAHQFQGSERDIMFFSPVVASRGNGGSDRWFDANPQILNVALSRARRLLHIIGDYDFCSRRSGCLGKIAASYRQIKNEESSTIPSMLEKFDTLEERTRYTCLQDVPEVVSRCEIELKRSVGPYTLDIALVGKVKVDVECDGAQHEIVDGLPVTTDVRRDEYLRRQGWKVIRVPNYRIHEDPRRVAAEIARALQE